MPSLFLVLDPLYCRSLALSLSISLIGPQLARQRYKSDQNLAELGTDPAVGGFLFFPLSHRPPHRLHRPNLHLFYVDLVRARLTSSMGRSSSSSMGLFIFSLADGVVVIFFVVEVKEGEWFQAGG